MNIKIRKEILNDNVEIYNLIRDAFKTALHSDGDEHNLVNRLRTSESFIPELSLVAEIDNKIVGHILFTKLSICDVENSYGSLSLAPLSVLPEYQNQGIGTMLVNEGLKKAKELGYSSAIVLGHELYYPRFGFKEASSFGISCPFEVPSENFMAVELNKDSLRDVSGTVVYAKEFFEI